MTRRIFAFTLLLVAVASAPAVAQPAGEPRMVEVDPVRCWWRTSQGSVSVGEPFSIVLTCAVLETSGVRVVVDESPLTVGTIQLAPFELIGGSHPADLRSGQRRFFQYDYSVRIIDPNAIGRDIRLPQLSIHYRVESNVQAQSLEGRDRTYLMPIELVRVVSMVPPEALDIRDGAHEPFAAIEAIRFRARVFDLVATALVVLAVVMLVPAVARAVQGTRRRETSDTVRVSDRAVLGAAVSELDRVQTEARGGWTPDLLARALAAARVAAGYAVGHRVRQRVTATGEPTDARLVVTAGLRRKQTVAVSSPVTADEVSRELEKRSAGDPARGRLEQLRDALSVLTGAVYGPPSATAASDSTAADAAVAGALTAARDLARHYGPLRVAVRRIRGRE